MVLKFGNDRNNYFSKNSRESILWVHLKRIISDVVVVKFGTRTATFVCVICVIHQEKGELRSCPHSELPKPSMCTGVGCQRKRACFVCL